MILKAATSYSRKFRMVLNTDHVTGATGKTVTVMLSKGPGAAGTTAAGPVTELDSTNLPGLYQVALTTVDTAITGDLGFDCTATGCDHTSFVEQVQGQVFTDLMIDGSGRAYVTSNLRQNATFTALFFMTQLGSSNPAPGLTVTGQRTFGAGGFSNVSGTILEVGGAGLGAGWYVFNGTAADSAGACGGFKMTSLGANDTDFTLWFQP